MKLTDEQVKQKFEYLKKRANKVIEQLRILSTDGRYTHECNSKILLINSWESLSEYNIKNNKDFVSSIITFEQYIITAEDYLVKVAQGL